ncbi:putative plant self-incompatibility response [Arabidopsis thaliana]
MRHATSPIVFCFLIFLVMNHVKGKRKKKPCPIGLHTYGKCGTDRAKFCFSEIESKLSFSKQVLNTISSCRCDDDRQGNKDYIGANVIEEKAVLAPQIDELHGSKMAFFL